MASLSSGLPLRTTCFRFGKSAVVRTRRTASATTTPLARSVSAMVIAPLAAIVTVPSDRHDCPPNVTFDPDADGTACWLTVAVNATCPNGPLAAYPL